MKNYYTDALFARKEYGKMGKYLQYYVPVKRVRNTNEPHIIPFPTVKVVVFSENDEEGLDFLGNIKLITCVITIKEVFRFNNYYFAVVYKNSCENYITSKNFNIEVTEVVDHLLGKEFGIYERKTIYINYE